MNCRLIASPKTVPNPPPSDISVDTTPDETNTHGQISFLQLNCNRSKPVLLQLLSQQHHHVLLVQEPWINPHTLLAPTHQSWHLIMPLGYKPTNDDKRPKSCIYITKAFATATFTQLTSGSGLLAAVEIRDPDTNTLFHVISLYNPPTSFDGLPVLDGWMKDQYRRRIPTLLVMDGNLHHKMWNPPYRM